MVYGYRSYSINIFLLYILLQVEKILCNLTIYYNPKNNVINYRISFKYDLLYIECFNDKLMRKREKKRWKFTHTQLIFFYISFFCFIIFYFILTDA